MLARMGFSRVELVQGNIVLQEVDAIVNAANSYLAGGGGVDGAIHRAGGPDILRETRERHPQGCPTGQAVVTGAGLLKAKYVFHAVGPVWRGGMQNEAELLAAVYRHCLQLAAEQNCDSIAFPAISAGAYGYPTDLAAEVALHTIREVLVPSPRSVLVRFVLFDGGTFGAFARVLESMLS